ncbi:MAG: DUF6567 family protein [Bacteroidota bacterium]
MKKHTYKVTIGKRIKGFFLIITITSFVSCSYHVGTIGGGSAVITNNQFSRIDFAYGTAKTTNVLGIGGNHKNGLVLEAKRNLYQNSQLQAGQAIGQTTVDFKRTFFFPVMTTRVIISAEIIDFSDKPENTEISQDALKDFAGPRPSFTTVLNDIEPGMDVQFLFWGDFKEAKVLGIYGSKVVLKYLNSKNEIRIKRVSPSKLSGLTDEEKSN